MKKILCIIMVFILTLSVAGCTFGKSNSEKTAKNFMDAFCEFNLKEAFEYLENKDSHTLPFETLDQLIESMRISMEQGESVDGMNFYVDKFLVPIYTRLVEKLSYSISGTEKQEDKYTVNVNLETINAENITTSDLNFEDIMSELATELTENGTLNKDMSQEDFLAVIMENAPEKMAEKMLLLMDNAGTHTIPVKLVIKKVDGKYLITDESDIETLLTSTSLNM
ncbi:MAG: hypothetical protein E7407_04620 [Ruminococcaceae bacterium]|nr:hypothetical protein [Oscillospiraceae bacterium]